MPPFLAPRPVIKGVVFIVAERCSEKEAVTVTFQVCRYCCSLCAEEWSACVNNNKVMADHAHGDPTRSFLRFRDLEPTNEISYRHHLPLKWHRSWRCIDQPFSQSQQRLKCQKNAGCRKNGREIGQSFQTRLT